MSTLRRTAKQRKGAFRGLECSTLSARGNDLQMRASMGHSLYLEERSGLGRLPGLALLVSRCTMSGKGRGTAAGRNISTPAPAIVGMNRRRPRRGKGRGGIAKPKSMAFPGPRNQPTVQKHRISNDFLRSLLASVVSPRSTAAK